MIFVVISAALICGGALVCWPLVAKFAFHRSTPVLVVFRYDDFSQKDHQTGLERSLIKEFAKRKIACTFGVIPYVCQGDARDSLTQPTLPLTGVKAELLRDAVKQGSVDVAQHGFSHQTVNMAEGRHYAEFMGIPLEVQMNNIGLGRALLSGICGRQIQNFVPPWNAYDTTTIQALERLGFTCLSGDRHGPVGKSSSLTFVPSTSELCQLKVAVESALRSPDPSPVVVVNFHAFDFVEEDPFRGWITLPQFAKQLDWVVTQPLAKVVTLSEVSISTKTKPAHYRALVSFESWKNLLPHRLTRVMGLNRLAFLPSACGLRVFQSMLWGTAILLLTFIASLVGLLTLLTLRWTGMSREIAGGLGFALNLVLALRITIGSKHRRVSAVQFVIASTMVGLATGIVIYGR